MSDGAVSVICLAWCEANDQWMSVRCKTMTRLLADLKRARAERDEARETAEQFAIENETTTALRVLKERDRLARERDALRAQLEKLEKEHAALKAAWEETCD